MAPLTLTARTEFLHRALAAARAARTPALRFNPVIAAAQAALESNWGRSQLATRANNIKGVRSQVLVWIELGRLERIPMLNSLARAWKTTRKLCQHTVQLWL